MFGLAQPLTDIRAPFEELQVGPNALAFNLLVMKLTMNSPSETETIMVAEDEDCLRRFVARLLGDTGYTVIEARDGVDALELAAAYTGRIDLLLTDWAMPRLEGVRLTKNFRAVRPETRVLFVTGCREDIPATPDSVLPKPFRPGDLLARVRALLSPG